jgi:hypothetical protein
MNTERWGSLSVSDHVDTVDLAANVLLYDRLVMPVMTAQPDRDELAYWERAGWKPDLQRQRLDQLEELAVCRPWNAARRAAYKDRLAALKAEQHDAARIDHFGLTRMILAQEQQVQLPPGVAHVDVLAAYDSDAALTREFALTEARDHAAAQALLLTRRLALPDLKDPEDALKLACKLSRDSAFRDKRAALFDWQHQQALKGLSPEAAVESLAAMTDAYNAAVQSAATKVRWKLAFTVFGIGLGFATGGAAAAAASAALSLVQFATLDKEPVIEAGRAAPAAMFHDMQARVGFALKPA